MRTGANVFGMHASNDIEYLGAVMTNEQRVQLEKHKDKLRRQRLHEYRKETGDNGIKIFSFQRGLWAELLKARKRPIMNDSLKHFFQILLLRTS